MIPTTPMRATATALLFFCCACARTASPPPPVQAVGSPSRRVPLEGEPPPPRSAVGEPASARAPDDWLRAVEAALDAALRASAERDAALRACVSEFIEAGRPTVCRFDAHVSRTFRVRPRLLRRGGGAHARDGGATVNLAERAGRRARTKMISD